MYLESKFRRSSPSNVVCTKNIIIGINSSVSRKQLLQFGFERKEENRQILLALNYLYIFTALLYNAMVYGSRFKLIQTFFCTVVYQLETVQDFLIKLDIKPLIHLLEISVFSLNNDLVRLTKIMNNLVKDLKILSFKVIFQCLKLSESFQKIFSVKNI